MIYLHGQLFSIGGGVVPQVINVALENGTDSINLDMSSNIDDISLTLADGTESLDISMSDNIDDIALTLADGTETLAITIEDC